MANCYQIKTKKHFAIKYIKATLTNFVEIGVILTHPLTKWHNAINVTIWRFAIKGRRIYDKIYKYTTDRKVHKG